MRYGIKRQESAIVHINVTGFASSVAIARDRSLREQVFVVAEPRAGRAVLLDVSPRALEEGLAPGMALSEAVRRVRNLQILAPDVRAMKRASEELCNTVKPFAPLVEQVPGGHLYLDLTGTTRLFGPPADVAIRIRRTIIDAINLDPALALAPNKLTAKVATRTLRPAGFAAIRTDEAADFLSCQDIRLLPGIGPVLLKLLHTAGIYTIGVLAELSDHEARILLGKHYSKLVQYARGLDTEPVYDSSQGRPIIERELQFQGSVSEREVLRGALMALVEDAGMALRQQRLAARSLELSLRYADGIERCAQRRFFVPLSQDRSLFYEAEQCLTRAMDRRVRIGMMRLKLRDLERDYGERDLFIPATDQVHTELQQVIDRNRQRFGMGSLVRGTTLLAQGYAGSILCSHNIQAQTALL